MNWFEYFNLVATICFIKAMPDKAAIVLGWIFLIGVTAVKAFE